MDGPNLIAGANVGFNPGAPWHVVDTGDFNGDSMSDILWQHDDGSVAVWTMDGHSVIAGANVGFNPGATWHVKNAADFGGDGSAVMAISISAENPNARCRIALLPLMT
jgi:hypothetical protein